MAASAKVAFVPTGTMVVVAGCLTAAAFLAFAAASSALADGPASEPFWPFSDGITTVSALVSTSGREAGSGPKTERLFLPGLPAGGLSASAGAVPPSAAAVGRGFWPPRDPAMSITVSSRMSWGRVMSTGRLGFCGSAFRARGAWIAVGGSLSSDRSAGLMTEICFEGCVSFWASPASAAGGRSGG